MDGFVQKKKMGVIMNRIGIGNQQIDILVSDFLWRDCGFYFKFIDDLELRLHNLENRHRSCILEQMHRDSFGE